MTLMQFTNDGDEYHEIDIEKLADGEERSVDELLDLMQTAPDQAAALVTPVALTFAPPKSATYAIFSLAPRPVPRHVSRSGRPRLRKHCRAVSIWTRATRT